MNAKLKQMQLYAVATPDLAAQKKGFLEADGYTVTVLGPMSWGTFDLTDLRSAAIAEGSNVWCVYGVKES